MKWPAEHGVNAGNWGDRIEWNVVGFMDNNIKNDGNTDEGHLTWCTWSHETTHYLDNRLFFKDEAQAFLKSIPEQKEQIGIQVNYPDYDKYQGDPEKFYLARLRSGFSQLKAEQWEAMDLNNIDDLIKNKIMIYPSVYKFSLRGDNSYGGEGINIAHWYQPNTPNGRPDSRENIFSLFCWSV